MNALGRMVGWAIAGSLPLLVAPPSYGQLIKITDVIVVPIGDSLQLLLETADADRLEVFQTRTPDALVIDIPAAQLALPTVLPFQRRYSSGPVTEITVEQFDDTTVRLTLMGTTDLPEVFQSAADNGLALDVFPADTLAEGPEPIESTPANLQLIVVAKPPPRYAPLQTGTRTGADLLDTPQSIQSVSQEVVEDQGGVSVGTALRNVSGVSTGRLGSGGRGSFPIIRGFESTNILRNGLRDDTLRFGATINNIERVEILKGPSSVLFGSGDLGGVINLVTERPLYEPRYEVEFTFGSDALIRTQADFTGPMDDTNDLAYRLNLVYEEGGSFQDFAETDFFFIAPTLQFINTERTSLVVDFEHSRTRIRGSGPGLPAVPAIGLENNSYVDQILALGIPIAPESLATAGTLDLRTNVGEPSISEDETILNRVGYQFSHRFSDNWQFENQFLYSFQKTFVSNLTAGVDYVTVVPFNFNLLRRVYLENPSRREGYTANANFIGNFDLFGLEQTLLLGAEWSYEIEEDILTLQVPFGAAPFDVFQRNYNPQSFFIFGAANPSLDSFTRTQTLGLYGQTQINLSDSILLVLGGRFDMAEQFFQDRASIANPDPIETYDTVFSPRAGLVFRPGDDLSLYASYAESFQPTIGQNISGDVLLPEFGRQFEVGIKASLLDNRLLATLAYYDLTRSNVLEQDPANNGYQIQVGEQNSRGIEFDLVGEILPGWDIIASYAYTDARVTQDEVFETGVRLVNAPDHAASLWTSYQFQSGALEGLGLGLGVYFVGDRNGSLSNPTIRTISPFEIPGYTRTDAALFYQRGDFRAQLNVQNLFDVRYFEGARNQVRVIPGQPLTVTGSLSWTF
mgnify:CR=1 FL=1